MINKLYREIYILTYSIIIAATGGKGPPAYSMIAQTDRKTDRQTTHIAPYRLIQPSSRFRENQIMSDKHLGMTAFQKLFQKLTKLIT